MTRAKQRPPFCRQVAAQRKGLARPGAGRSRSSLRGQRRGGIAIDVGRRRRLKIGADGTGRKRNGAERRNTDPSRDAGRRSKAAKQSSRPVHDTHPYVHYAMNEATPPTAGLELNRSVFCCKAKPVSVN